MLVRRLPEKGRGGARELRASDARRFQRTADELDASDERGEVPCGCAVDEVRGLLWLQPLLLQLPARPPRATSYDHILWSQALGLAMALRCAVHVERGVWEAAARTPRYSLQRGLLRISLPEQSKAESDVRVELDRRLSCDAPPPRLPWE